MEENTKVIFDIKKISAFTKVSSELLSEVNLMASSECEDIINDLITIRINGYFCENMSEQRVLKYYCERPKFLDWLFRRKKEVKFNLDVNDLLLNPPKLKERTKRIYVVNDNS